MENKTDKNSYTIVFAVIMVSIVAAILAYFATALKSKIGENKRFEKQQNILYAMGVNENDESSVVFIPTNKVEETFKQYIKKQIIIQGDQITEDDDAYLIDVKKEESLAKNASYERRLPLFIGEKDGQTYYIVPLTGKGLWDAVWGYMAIDQNMVVKGVFFDHKGETPGLGANINQRFFMDDFEGELISKNGEIEGVTVKKGNADPKNVRKDDLAVDAIAGATITGDGVTAMIKKDLKLYASYFKSLKK